MGDAPRSPIAMARSSGAIRVKNVVTLQLPQRYEDTELAASDF
jgi:hypothetical protein